MCFALLFKVYSASRMSHYRKGLRGFVLLTSCLAVLSGCGKASKAEALGNVRNWAILLNPPAPEGMTARDFVDYDLLILDPDRHPPLEAARGEGRLLLGYVSLGEAEEYRPYWSPVAGAPWILQENPNWPGNRGVDVRDSAWRRLILEQEIPRVLAGGFDGLFLDTLDVGPEREAAGFAGSRAAMLDLVGEIRRRFPGILVVSNNGLGLLPELGDRVDAFLVEGLNFEHDFARNRTVRVSRAVRKEKLAALHGHPGLPVFVVDYTQDPFEAREAVARSRREGFHPYVAPLGLDRLQPPPMPAAPAIMPELSTEPAPGVFSRTILALYDSREPYNAYYFSAIPANAEMVLNHLGCVVRYHDVAKGLPDLATLADIRGILTWFRDDQMEGAEAYCRWLLQAVRAGHRLVILEDLGALKDAKTGAEVPADLPRAIFREMGLSLGSSWTGRPLRIKVASKDPDWVEFERSLDGEAESFTEVHAVDPRCRTFLKLERTDKPGTFADAVVLCPKGGYVQSGYAVYTDPREFRRQWRIDPLRFFEAAFGLEGSPRPAVTTQNGRRLWFSQIDGDGFRNECPAEPGKLCSEVVRDRVFARYPLPFTVSVVACEMDPKAFGTPRIVEIAKSIFALPNVEPASHGYAHPQDWLTRELTIKNVPGYAYDEKAEITGAVDAVNAALVPPGKRVGLFQWTGACNPTESALGIADAAGLLNLNGGDTRMDPEFPTYTMVAPLTRHVGDRLQVHAGALNDNILTHGFTEPLFGFRNVLKTFENTENPTVLWTQRGPPRRVKPIDVYFHFFPASEPAALKALLEVVDTTSRWEIAPVYASDYVRKVHGFLAAGLESLGGGRWRIRSYGDCRTVRFDGEGLLPDLGRSRNCLGFRQEPGRLYVHLDRGEAAEIALAAAPVQDRPWLESSSHVVEGLETSPSSLRFESRGYGTGAFTFAGLAEGAWELWTRGGSPSRLAALSCAKDGRVSFSAPAGSYDLRRGTPP